MALGVVPAGTLLEPIHNTMTREETAQMKRVLLSIGLALLLMAMVGCQQQNLRGACGNANCDRCGLLGARGGGAPTAVPHLPRNYAAQPQAGGGGASMGAVGYPYYTVRAPRDFLYNQPPSIGP